MHKFVFGAVAITVVLVPAVVMTQGAKTKPTTATYITKEEVDIVNHQGQGTGRIRNIKVVDIGHENFTVGIIHRGKTVNGILLPAAGAAANAAPAAGRGAAAPPPTPCGRQMATAPAGGSAGGITHDSQTEAYYIVSGGGTMFTGGYIVNGRHNVSPDYGPTCDGMAYDVVKKVVKPGDIIIVPAGVVHGWLDIPDHVECLLFRPSPGTLTAGWVHPALKK